MEQNIICKSELLNIDDFELINFEIRGFCGVLSLITNLYDLLTL